MAKAEVTITNSVGLHARPAAQFVQAANKFKSRINVAKDDLKVNAKSIIGVLSLGAGKGAKIVLEASGEDEAEAVAALKSLIESGFGEH
ncbi:MAG TPA: HPr family phosphocarrier protein [Bacillota bacterium]